MLPQASVATKAAEIQVTLDASCFYATEKIYIPRKNNAAPKNISSSIDCACIYRFNLDNCRPPPTMFGWRYG